MPRRHRKYSLADHESWSKALDKNLDRYKRELFAAGAKLDGTPQGRKKHDVARAAAEARWSRVHAAKTKAAGNKKAAPKKAVVEKKRAAIKAAHVKTVAKVAKKKSTSKKAHPWQ